MFPIIIQHDRRRIRLTVTRISQTASSEQYQVDARNGTMILETNWPIFRNRGLKHRRPDWKVITGHLTYDNVTKSIIEAIEGHVREEWKKEHL